MITISDKDFDRAVQAAYDSIPDEFLAYMRNIIIEVRDKPDRELLEKYEETDDLLGLFDGVPLEDQADEHAPLLPNRIFLFRDNLCQMCETRAELVDEIRVTLLHEIGHHFGLDEDRLEELGYE